MIKVFADGRVAKDASVFTYGDGKKGVSFGLICDRFYGDENPTYIQCTIFNRDERTAESIYMGRQMVVTGDLTRKDQYYSIVVSDYSYGQEPKNRNRQQGYAAQGEPISVVEEYAGEGVYRTQGYAVDEQPATGGVGYGGGNYGYGYGGGNRPFN